VHVVGIDLSLESTGLARFVKGDPELAVIGRSGVTVLPLYERLDAIQELAGQLFSWIYSDGDPGLPDLVVMEAMATSRAYGGLVERAWLWFEVADRLRHLPVPVVEVPTRTRMRYATGKGAASKGAIIDMVARRLPMFDTKGEENLCDAAVLCAMGRDHLGEPLAPLPATHRAALDAVKWPS
jgi:crossover junction endodeoxyribonuclease RuvC